MIDFLSQLFSSDEKTADSLVVGSYVALVSLLIFQGASVWHDPASFNPINFGTAAGSILALQGAGRGMRCTHKDGDQ